MCELGRKHIPSNQRKTQLEIPKVLHLGKRWFHYFRTIKRNLTNIITRDHLLNQSLQYSKEYLGIVYIIKEKSDSKKRVGIACYLLQHTSC